MYFGQSVCCFAHQSVVDASARFLARLNRLNYVTPMSYMEMLGAYADMFGKKRTAILTEVNALKTGQPRLNNCYAMPSPRLCGCVVRPSSRFFFVNLPFVRQGKMHFVGL